MIRKLFNNRAFIIALAVCSGLLMLRSVARPFLDEPDYSDVEAPVFDPEEEGMAEFEVLASEREDTVQDEQPIWRPDQSVLSGQLTWIDKPARDPFSGMTGPSMQSTITKPLNGQSEMPVVPRLDALVAGPDSLIAVLNDQIVRVGDLVGDYEVTRIAPDGVRIANRFASHWLAVADMEIEAHKPATETESDDGFPGGSLDGTIGWTGSPEPGG